MLVTEIEQKIRMIEDITGEEISDNHAKSVLIGILDPMTGQHTAREQGSEVSFEKFNVDRILSNLTDPPSEGSSEEEGARRLEAPRRPCLTGALFCPSMHPRGRR